MLSPIYSSRQLAIFSGVIRVHFLPVIGSPAVSNSRIFLISSITSGVFFPPFCAHPLWREFDCDQQGFQKAPCALLPRYEHQNQETLLSFDRLRDRAWPPPAQRKAVAVSR